MRRLAVELVCAGVLAAAAGSPRAEAYIADDRWMRTATNGTNVGTQGSPITLTWSIAPDGTMIPGDTTGSTVPSNLRATLDASFGAGPGGSDLTQRPWFPIFAQSYDRLDALCGVTFVYEPNDDGHNFSNVNSSSFRGVLGVRGDLRLGGKSYGAGSNILASNYFPDYGEMMINTDQTGFFLNSNDNYRAFRNTLMHETMHGLGISHVDSSDAGFLIEPFLSTSFDGPQLDDLLALQRLYGDVYEKNGGNDVASRATPLGSLSAGQSLAKGTLGNSTQIFSTQTDFLSIDDDSDTDFFSFVVSARLDVTLALAPRGATYLVGPQGGTQSSFNSQALSNLSLALFDTNGTSLLASADANPAGSGEQIVRQLLPGTYFARVKGANNDIQLYGLDVAASVPLPKNLVWVGNVSANWNVGTTANFNDGSGASVFYDDDHVVFNDSSAVRNVNLPANVAPGSVRVTTAASYRFAGPGGIVAGSLTVDGPGVVELANSGNSYAGATQVAAGALKISGDASAMVSPIAVAEGAALVVASNTALSAPLALAGAGAAGGGALQIADGHTVQLSGPVTLVGSGATIGVETAAAGELTGSIDGTAESSRLTLRAAAGASLAVQGAVQLASGGVTKLEAGTAELGGPLDYAGATHVEAGTLRLAGSGTMAGEFDVAAGATLELAGAHEFAASSRLAGRGLVVGDLTMPGAIAPGSSTGELTLADDLTLAPTSRLEIELGGTQAGIDYDRLAIGGLANLAGTLDVSLTGDFAPALADLFEVLRAEDGIFHAFDHFHLPALGPQLAWNVIYSNFSVLVEVVGANVAALPGDYSQDGVVDLADYVIWRTNEGTDNALPNDLVGGTIGQPQYDQWRSHFGETAGASGGASATTAVPEPAAWALVAIAAVGFCSRWRRSIVVAGHP